MRSFAKIKPSQNFPHLQYYVNFCSAGAQCCLEMQKYEDCINWCDDVLAVSFSNRGTGLDKQKNFSVKL